jgi:hypothetical protein
MTDEEIIAEANALVSGFLRLDGLRDPQGLSLRLRHTSTGALVLADGGRRVQAAAVDGY